MANRLFRLRWPQPWPAVAQIAGAIFLRQGLPHGLGTLLGVAGLSLPLLPVSRTAYVGFLVTLAIFAWLWSRGEDLRSLGLARPKGWLRPTAVWFGAVLLCLAYSALLEPILDPLLPPDKAPAIFSEVRRNTSLYLAVLPMIWLFAAIGEELFYRGFILNRAQAVYRRFRFSWLFANVTQAALFGLAHWYQGMSGVIGAFAYGLLFGLAVRTAKGSLVPAMLAHGTIDTLGFTLLFLGRLS